MKQSLGQHLSPSIVQMVLSQGDNYGLSDFGKNKKIHIEFVSATPTSPLHVSHGRAAAYGASLANMLKATGHDVHCEYYVKDAGHEMDILAVSVWLRYLELAGEEINFPSYAYQGDYVWDIGASLHRENGDVFRKDEQLVFNAVHADYPAGDQQKHIDDLIVNAKKILGEVKYRAVYDLALNTLIDVIRTDLHQFGVDYDSWFSERHLTDKGLLEKVIKLLQTNGTIYESAGALCFKSTDFDDVKDRVIKNENGQTTHFASTIAYHLNKFDRGFDQFITICEAEHYGFISSITAALKVMDYSTDKLDILLVQIVNLYDNGEIISMSTHADKFVPLRTLRNNVGNDAARFFYLKDKADQSIDFNMNLAREKSVDNPVFNVQNAHACICNVEQQCAEQGIKVDIHDIKLEALNSKQEQVLLKQLDLYPECLQSAANSREPHIIIDYLCELSQQFHAWYTTDKFIVDDIECRNSRIGLVFAIRQVLKNGLSLIGVSTPEKM